MRLRSRIALVFVAVAMAGVGALAILDHRATLSRLREEQSARAEAIALAVGTQRAAALHRRGETGDDLRSLVEGLAQLYPDLASLVVRDANGRELAAARSAVDEAQLDRIRLDLTAVRGGSLGAVEVAFTTRNVRHSLRRRMLQLTGIATALTLTLILAAVRVARGITRPVEAVATAMRRVEEGDLDASVPETGAGEVAEMGRAFNAMVGSLREGREVRETFARYVSHQVAEQIIGGRIPVRLSGEQRHVAVLFCDLRGFTTLSERLSPQEVVDLLNEYFELLVTVIFAHGGTIDKFIGDALMAVFGAPVAMERPEEQAVRAAVDIQEAIEVLNGRRRERGQPPVQAGIGIHAGPVVAGNVGSSERMDYTVIGDTVNVAQRIEGATRPFFTADTASVVLVSGTVREAAQALGTFEQLDPIELRGRSGSVPIHRLVGPRGSHGTGELPSATA